MRSILLVAVLGLAAATAAPAATTDDDSWVFGLAAGQSKLHVSSDDFEGSGSVDTFGAKLFGGYRFNRNLSAELGWIHGGTLEESEDGLSVSIKPKLLTGALVASFPFGESPIGGFVKAGMTRWDATLTASDGVDSESADSNGTEFLWGLGLTWGLGNAAIRLEYEQTNIEEEIEEDFSADFRYSLLSLGIVWNF
jgi:OmpA-OmpF porin, OOP family